MVMFHSGNRKASFDPDRKGKPLTRALTGYSNIRAGVTEFY